MKRTPPRPRRPAAEERPLSERLEHLAREREVLALRRRLLRRGLLDGDRVRNLRTGIVGTLQVGLVGGEAIATVDSEFGVQTVVDPSHWQPEPPGGA